MLSSQKRKLKRQEVKSSEEFTATAQFVKEGYGIPTLQCSPDKPELALIKRLKSVTAAAHHRLPEQQGA